MLHRVRIPFLVASALLAVSSAAAQQETVPAELVRALLATPARAGHTPEIVVGRVPQGFPAELVPGGARVLGGVRRDSSSTVLAVAVPEAPPAAGEALQQALLGGGWAFPGTRERRGFVGPTSMQWTYLCRGNETVTVSSVAAPGGGSYLRVDYSREQASRCDPASPDVRSRPPWADVPLPVLNVPPGTVTVTTSLSSGMVGNGAGSASAGVRLRTAMGAAELLSRFAAQLGQAGWTASPPAASAEAGMQTFRLHAPDGKEWFGVLTSVAIPGSEVRDVQFEVSPLPPPTS